MVQKAFEVGWIPLVILIECENWLWNPFAVGDSGHAFGLCQMNNHWHKIPKEYREDWGFQIEYCNEKLKGWTKFYGPDRIIEWKKCSEYVMDRFTFTW